MEEVDDARNEVYVELTIRLMTLPSWSPESLLGRNRLGSYINRAAGNAYNEWFEKLMRRQAITKVQLAAAAGVTTPFDEASDGETSKTQARVIGAMRDGYKHHVPSYDPYSQDPAELVTTKYRHSLVSEAGMERALATVDYGLRSLPPEDAQFLARFIKHSSTAGTFRSFCELENGLDPRGRPNDLTNTHRRLKGLATQLADHLSISLEPVQDEQELALNFLHFVLTDLDSETATD